MSRSFLLQRSINLKSSGPIVGYTVGAFVPALNGVEVILASSQIQIGTWIVQCSANAAGIDPAATWGTRLTDSTGIPTYSQTEQPVSGAAGAALNSIGLLILTSPTIIELRAKPTGGNATLIGGFYILSAYSL